MPSRSRSRGPAAFALTAVIALTAPELAAQDDADAPIQGPIAPAPDRVVGIEVVGNRRYTDRQLVALLGQQVGDTLDQIAIAEGLRAMLRSFRVRGTVETRSVEDGLVLRLTVVELPFDLEPRFIGNVRVKLDEIYEWARISPDTELYLHQAPRIRERLIAAYKREGFYFIEIDEVVRDGGVDEAGNQLAPDVIFEIREGPKVHVKDVVIHGNEAMPERGMLLWKDGLREFADVQLQGPRLFGLFKDAFDQEVLDGDIQAMRQVFRDRGWLDVVVQQERLEFSQDRTSVTIHVRVDQGPRYRVEAIGIEGVERYMTPDGEIEDRPVELIYDQERLLELCELGPDVFYESRFQLRDGRSLREFYGERGYIFHDSLSELDRFEFLPPRLVFDSERAVVNVTYRLAQGRQQFVREILVSGNTNTSDRVIRGRVTVEPGEVADLTEISRSRSRIQALGFFSDSRPDVAHTEPFFRFLETDDPSWKDLEYIVDETNALGFNMSGGISSNTGFFGIFEIRKQNFDITDLPSSIGSAFGEIANGRAFHGAGQSLQLLFAPGTLTSAFEIRFREPDIFRRHTDRIGLDLLARRRLRIFESHDERREEYGAALRYQIGPDSNVRLGLTAGPINVSDLDGGGEPTLGDPLPVPQSLKDQEGDSVLAWLDVGYERNVLDDFFYPQNGNTIELGLRVYDGALGSDYDFAKLTAEWVHLGQFGDESPDARPGYRLLLSGGVAVPYGDSDVVPYSERFFLGGQRAGSLRAFDFRGVGPNDKGFPVGGETFVSLATEYRQPLITTTQPGTFREIEVIRGGFYFDMGVLDPEAGNLDFDELRSSAGVFIGLTLPLAFTLSYGVPLQEKEGDDEERLQFTIGF